MRSRESPSSATSEDPTLKPSFARLTTMLSLCAFSVLLNAPRFLTDTLSVHVCSGIEVIACIQTLGHLGQMLQWPKYGGLRDTAEVLLAESAETYTFIEKVSASQLLALAQLH